MRPDSGQGLARAACRIRLARLEERRRVGAVKGASKPKKGEKKKAQKSLKEKRTEKRAAKKFGSG